MNSFVMCVAVTAGYILFVTFCLMTLLCYIYVRQNGAAVGRGVVRPISNRQIANVPNFSSNMNDKATPQAINSVAQPIDARRRCIKIVSRPTNSEAKTARQNTYNKIVPTSGNVQDQMVKGNNHFPVRNSRYTATDIRVKNEALTVAELKKKFIFIILNISERNIQTKCEEMKDIISDECLPWLSNYIVTERVSHEPNYHLVYMKFLNSLNNKTLNSHIISDSVKHINVLLKSDKRKEKSSFRLLLNLGRWLGMITIAQDKSVRRFFGDLNELVVEAYYKGNGELHIVVPFVVKVLESCSDSKVYNTKSPWTKNILGCLSELLQSTSLKSGYLRFEIESLFKKLKIRRMDLNPRRVFRNSVIRNT